jgi:hypothetical protein
MCRYSWIKKINPRAVAWPAPPIAARTPAARVTARVPPTRRRASGSAAAAARAVPTTPTDCSAAPGSPRDRMGRGRPAWSGRRGAADARPDGARRPIPPVCRRPNPRGDRCRPREPAGRARRHRAAPSASRTSPRRQTPLTASCGCVRKAPPKDLALRSGSQRAAAFAPPAGDDRPPGAGAHPQAEAVHAGSAPVIRLEGPLALGHGVLLVIRTVRPLAPFVRGSIGGGSCYWPARSPVLIWVAAVSPTFGRLFEGTDAASSGQTWFAPTHQTHTSRENRSSRRPPCGTIGGERQANPRTS